MESQFKRFGAPVALVLVVSAWIFSWSRLYYGVDLVHEARHVLYQLDLLANEGLFVKELGIDQIAQLLVYPIFRLANEITGRMNSEGIVFHLRELKMMLTLGVGLLLVFVFRHRVALSSMILFAAPVVAFLPLGVPGVHPLSMAAPLAVLVVAVGWRWMQAPTIVKSWVLPIAALSLVIAVPEVLPVMVLGLVAFLFRKTKDNEPKLVKLHLAASLNLTLLLGFLAVRALNHEGVIDAWHLQNAVLGWKGADAAAWSPPSGNVAFVFAMALILAFVLPSRFFHPLFTGLAVGFAVWGWRYSNTPAELLISMLAPLVLCHFWRIRKALPFDFQPTFLVLASIGLAGVLGFTRGLPGVAVGFLPLIVFFFASGWVRELRWSVLASSYVFTMLLVIAQFESLPEGQTRRESLDAINDGRFKGLWTTRSMSGEIQSLKTALQKLPPGPVSLLVYDERPGYYLLSELEPMGFLYRFSSQPPLQAEIVNHLNATENMPDVAIDARVSGPSIHLQGFFESKSEYQKFDENEKFRIWIKSEFVENALKRL